MTDPSPDDIRMLKCFIQPPNGASEDASPENAPIVTTFEDIPPNGGYGWVCTFCVFMINVHTWGVNSAWGVILNYYLSHATFPSANHLEFAIIGGLSISQCLLIGPVVTKANDTMGTTITLLTGTALIFTALFTASYATQVWHLFLTQGICFGTGMGFTYLTATAILPKWFSTKRSFSSGLAASGAGLGGLAYNLVAGRVIETLGVHTTYRILAFCALVSNLLSSLLLKDRPHSHPHPAPRTLLNHRDLTHLEIILVSIWGISTDLGYIALIYSLPNYASSIGLTLQEGSVAGALLNLGLALGRPLIGYISDAYGRITIPMTMTALCALLCLVIWIPAHSYPLLLLFALCAGMVCGTFWSTIAPVLTDVVGLSRLPSTFGLICLTLVAPSTVAEAIALSMVGRSGYLGAQVYIACMFVLGALCLGVLRSWRFYEMERKAAGEAEGVGEEFPGYFQWMRVRKLFLVGRV
ncbi:MFS general substrate transporter [Aspergillus ibericus CBS 121593]|uniref:MFS general substrate transporter n=1 Tax=Aspergillus ibericus CBS 121593 TaxID=1448316 RepID=A0A395GNL5_9EURO|nr:MFS general substrate transporter [Aspergillus ibericus CBS 121593]RAK96974.1 MFS general substrate transporter [Aspergillus ibericus CBS 121593]